MRRMYTIDEDWPETTLDARVMLNNAVWHLRHVDPISSIDPRNILNEIQLSFESEVSK